MHHDCEQKCTAETCQCADNTWCNGSDAMRDFSHLDSGTRHDALDGYGNV